MYFVDRSVCGRLWRRAGTLPKSIVLAGPGRLKLVFAAALGLIAVPLQAQVIEINDDGGVRRHDGPALYLTPDMQPVAIRRPAQAVNSRTSSRNQGRLPAEAVANAIVQASGAHGISPVLVAAVAWQESRFNINARSTKGAIGIMQLMPQTAQRLRANPYDLASNIEGGVTYLSALLNRYSGDVVKALAAYNAGPDAVDRYRGVPPYKETRVYVANILDRLAHLPTSTASIGGAQ